MSITSLPAEKGKVVHLCLFTAGVDDFLAKGQEDAGGIGLNTVVCANLGLFTDLISRPCFLGHDSKLATS